MHVLVSSCQVLSLRTSTFPVMQNDRNETGQRRNTEHDEPGNGSGNLAVLETVRPFSRLSADDLAALARTTRTIEVSAHRQIATADMHGDTSMILIRGRAKHSLLSQRGGDFVLEIVEAGDLLAEHVLVAPERQPACVEALQRCKLLLVPGTAARRAMQRCPAALADLACVLQDKLDQRNDLIAALGLPLAERVLWRLSQLAQRCGVIAGSRLLIRHGLSQRDLAATIGVSRESLNRCLASFARQDRIEVHRREIVLRHRESLEQRSGSGIDSRIPFVSAARPARRQCVGATGTFGV